ncbi:MAG: DUF5597 domain-containing protein [Janthinobacterium lividum]
MNLRKTLLPLCLLATHVRLPAQTVADPTMPRVDRTGVHPALIVDGKPFLMLSAQMNNSSAWPATLPAVWSVMDKLGSNTIEAPVYWEMLEPQEDTFDFAPVDALLQGARGHGKRLVLLWFGTWKNGSPGYAPEWVKRDPKRFPLALKADGTPLFSLSPFGEASLHADEHAFTALMQHLKSVDPQHTVLMVQVENEAGVWGGARDHSAMANRVFGQPVPREVLTAMGKEGQHGSWAEVFGTDADETFYAWAIAHYIEQIAAAGKRVLPLPLYVNAALRDPLPPGAPGTFESGGPTFDVLPLWHAVAPSLDGIGPDIYLPEYEKYTAVLQQYAFPGNAFFVPETGNRTAYARYFFASLGAGAFGWSPFGMDATGYVNYPLGAPRIDDDTIAPFALNYRIAGSMSRELALWNQQGRVRGVAEDPKVHTQQIELPPVDKMPARWTATVSYGEPSFYSSKPAPGNSMPEGEALVVALGPDEFLVAGVQCRVEFNALAVAGAKKQRMWVSVEEGTYEEGVWKRSRLWNGDQTDYGLNFTATPQVLRVRLLAF